MFLASIFTFGGASTFTLLTSCSPAASVPGPLLRLPLVGCVSVYFQHSSHFLCQLVAVPFRFSRKTRATMQIDVTTSSSFFATAMRLDRQVVDELSGLHWCGQLLGERVVCAIEDVISTTLANRFPNEHHALVEIFRSPCCQHEGLSRKKVGLHCHVQGPRGETLLPSHVDVPVKAHAVEECRQVEKQTRSRLSTVCGDFFMQASPRRSRVRCCLSLHRFTSRECRHLKLVPTSGAQPCTSHTSALSK